MTTFAQQVVNGLIIGSTYSLMGIGLTLVFGIMRVVNFAHGEFYMLGAFIAYFSFTFMGLPFPVAVTLAVAAVMVLAWLCDQCLLRPVRDKDILVPMLILIGISIMLQNFAIVAFGSEPKTMPAPFPPTTVELGGVFISLPRLVLAGISVGVIAALSYVLKATNVGRAMRATWQDAETAALMGVNINRVYGLTFTVGCGLAAAAGSALAPIFWVYPTMGELAVLKSFAIVILGGLGSVAGAIYGGLLLGLAESLGAGYISAEYKDAVGFLVIIIVLLLRPYGLFGRRGIYG